MSQWSRRWSVSGKISSVAEPSRAPEMDVQRRCLTLVVEGEVLRLPLRGSLPAVHGGLTDPGKTAGARNRGFRLGKGRQKFGKGLDIASHGPYSVNSSQSWG